MKLSAFPSGWVLGFLIAEVGGPDYQVGFMPIVGMEICDDGDHIHAIVASPTGELVRDRDVEHPIICIVGPDENRERVARAGLAEYLAKRQPAAQARA